MYRDKDKIEGQQKTTLIQDNHVTNNKYNIEITNLICINNYMKYLTKYCKFNIHKDLIRK